MMMRETKRLEQCAQVDGPTVSGGADAALSWMAYVPVVFGVVAGAFALRRRRPAFALLAVQDTVQETTKEELSFSDVARIPKPGLSGGPGMIHFVPGSDGLITFLQSGFGGYG